MDHIQGLCRDQLTLFPEALDDYITPDNPVRFIDAYVDSLDLHRLGFRHAMLQETGRPPYHPGDLLKLYLYGYLNRVRSSRLLERETHRNVEVSASGVKVPKATG
jgi:transposase